MQRRIRTSGHLQARIAAKVMRTMFAVGVDEQLSDEKNDFNENC